MRPKELHWLEEVIQEEKGELVYIFCKEQQEEAITVLHDCQQGLLFLQTHIEMLSKEHT